MSKELENIIERVTDSAIKIVSFDIFDTLLLRPMIDPADFFRLIGKKHGCTSHAFTTIRTSAEREARNAKPFGYDDITLDDIYAKIESCFGVSHTQAEAWKRTELALEEQLLYPRESAKRIFHAALAAGKRIVIASDMYLPIHFIQSILDKNGYKGYTKIYLSSELMKSKGTGRLFQQMIAEWEHEGISAKEILHIGDNPTADGKQAERAGLQSILLPRAVTVFQANRIFRCIAASRLDFDNTFLVGFLANLLFDDPFVVYDCDTAFNGEAENIGWVIAPFLFSFVKWMLEDVLRIRADKLLVIYRDGYLPEKLLDILKPYYHTAFSMQKAYLNRTLRYAHNAIQPYPLIDSDIPVSSHMTVEEFIRTRLFVTDDVEIQEVFRCFKKSGYFSLQDEIGSMDRIYRLAAVLTPYFKRRGGAQWRLVQAYCERLVENADRIAIFDIGYRGSVVRFLQTLFPEKEFVGYQLLATPTARLRYGSVHLKNYVEYSFSIQQSAMILHPLMEQMISSMEESPVRVEIQGDEFVFLRERKISTSDSIIPLQEKILHYAQGFAKCFGRYLPLLEFDPYHEFSLLLNILQHPNHKDAAVIRRFDFDDALFISGQNTSGCYENWFKVKVHSPALPAFSDTEKVKDILRKMHLFSLGKAVYRSVVPYSHGQNENYISAFISALKQKLRLRKSEKQYSSDFFLHRAEQKIEASLNGLKTYVRTTQDSRVVVLGAVVSFDKGVCAFLNRCADRMSQYDWLLLSEATWLTLERTVKKINFPVHVLPDLFGQNHYERNLELLLAEDVRRFLTESETLRNAAQNLYRYSPEMTETYSTYVTVTAYRYFKRAFQIIKPKFIILWNEFYALHVIAKYVANELGIAIRYMEFGSLPGTIAIDTEGQMGESSVATGYEQFREMPVSNENIKQAEIVLQYLKESKLNRNQQPKNLELYNLIKRLQQKKRPVVFYAGQNDYESGLYPYTKDTKTYHSPYFHSSDEAAVILAQMAKKYQWELIYKPHPLVKSPPKGLPHHVHVLRNCDINDVIDFADVTVTILSQTGYIAAIREKPVVMMGYTQLRGKRCTYEAFDVEAVEVAICSALANGMTKEMKENFQRHVAQMNTYYLYDDNLPRAVRYGRAITDKSLEETLT